MELLQHLTALLKSLLRLQKRDPLAIAIDKLGDESEKVRAKAGKRLLIYGLHAVPALVAALEAPFSRLAAEPMVKIVALGKHGEHPLSRIKELFSLPEERLSRLLALSGAKILERQNQWFESEKRRWDEATRLLGELGGSGD